MKYTLFITDTNGNTTEKQIEALNAKQAHDLTPIPDGYTVKAFPTTTDENGELNVYALMRGALQVAKRCAEKALANGGTDTQRRIANELVTVNAKVGANGAEKYGVDYLLDLISRTSVDSQNFHSEAYTAILSAYNNGLSIDEQYRDAFKAVNRYIMKQRSATEKECSTEYIQEQGGNVVAVNTVIHRIINADDRYIPTVGGEMDDKTAERLGRVLVDFFGLLPTRKKNIVYLRAKGYSISYIQKKLNIKSAGMVDEHLTNIQSICIEYLEKNAPEFLSLIKEFIAREKIEKQKERNITDRHKNNSERMREYRKRKKEEKNGKTE